MVSSAGGPITVTTGVAFFTVMRTVSLSPGSVSSLASSTPTGTLLSSLLTIRKCRQSASGSPADSSRGPQSGTARRTSSWWTKYSTVLTRSSMPGRAKTDIRGGPDRIA
jgi:hypothetical protein